MQLHYCDYSKLSFPANHNVGDDLNPWLWPDLLTNFFDDDPSWVFLGIGTILDSVPKNSSAVIFGSGHRNSGAAPDMTHWKIYCVRGPRTTKALGISPSFAITDPAVLCPEKFRLPIGSRSEVAFIPHVGTAVTYDSILSHACELAGLTYIDPRLSPVEFITKLASCDFTLCEAMHGAILSDSYGIPWSMLITSNHIDLWKWFDWAESLELNLKYQRIRSMSGTLTKLLPKGSSQKLTQLSIAAQLRLAQVKCQPQISSELIRKNRIERLMDALENLKRDRKAGFFERKS